MSGPQQFSLRWNNYSQHIVTAIEELRTDDEFTDVTLSCEGQRIKGHKMLLSACSSYFRETFKENPCKHPIIILKGVSFHDLEAVVQFMYNGQVNVSQDGLPSFLATAELLQIKGLTDMNDREDFPLSTKISNSVNKRMLAGILPQSHLQNQNSNSSLSHSASRSGTPDNVQQQRPPSPKRKRIIADNFDGGPSASSGAFASSSSSTPTQQPVMGSSGSNGPSASSSTAGNSGLTNQSPMLMSAVANAGTSLAGASQAEGSDPFNSNNVTIKYEEEGMQDEDDYDEKHNMSSEDNDNSIQDMMGHMEPGSLGSFMGGSGSGGLGTSGTDSSHGSSQPGRMQLRPKRTPVQQTPQQRPSMQVTLSKPKKQETQQLDEELLQRPGPGGHVLLGSSLLDQIDINLVDEEGQLVGDEDDDVDHFVDDDDFDELGYLVEDGSRPGSSGMFAGRMGHLPSKTVSSVALSRKLEAPYTCDLCGKSYVHSCTLVQHKKLHEGQTRCRLCAQTLSNVSNLRAHYQTVHGYSNQDVQGKFVFQIKPTSVPKW